MTASHVQVAPDSTGKDVDADSVVSTEAGTPTVYRQNVVIADPTTYANKMAVTAANAAKVDGSGVTQPVSGTVGVSNFPADQLVHAANLDVALSTRLKPADTLAGVTTVAAVTAITNALPAGTNRIGSVRPVDSADADLTSAKGTQTARAVGVQRLNDAGRNTRIFALDAFVAAPLVEAVQSVVQWYGNAAVAGTTQPAVVPAGKTLRLTGWRITYRSIATFGSAIVRIRCNVTGLGVLASPLVASFEAGSNLGATTVAIVGAVTTESGEFPEGLEIPAAAGLAFSMAGYGPTGTLTLEGPVRFEIHGYEY